jgi:alcohol dehydrogenase class IV
MNSVWKFATANSLQFGRGSRRRLLPELARFVCQHPLVVTDSNLAQLPTIRDLLQELQSQCANLTVFDGGRPEPTLEIAEAAIRAGRQACVDSVIGLGGGSNLDVAKITATVIRHGGAPQDFFGFDRIPGPVLPVFALPTTAGTGSEVSHSAVLTDSQQATKVSTLSAWLRPTAAIVDPELTDTCPTQVTAHSGIDALVHAVEALTNRDFSQMADVDPQARAYEGSYPLTRLLAAEAIRLIGKSLAVACAEPANHSARDDMALAATLAGMAFSNSGVAVVHALEYPIGALTHCSHGEGNGLLLPHVMRYNLPASESAFRDIATWLGEDVAGLDNTRAAERGVAAVMRLQQQIGIRTHLRQLGLQSEDIPEVAVKAFSIKRLMDINARTPSLRDLEGILEAAY